MKQMILIIRADDFYHFTFLSARKRNGKRSSNGLKTQFIKYQPIHFTKTMRKKIYKEQGE